nr:MAG TPA: hypothetical protein [Caudoviricetes sp.]
MCDSLLNSMTYPYFRTWNPIMSGSIRGHES